MVSRRTVGRIGVVRSSAIRNINEAQLPYQPPPLSSRPRLPLFFITLLLDQALIAAAAAASAWSADCCFSPHSAGCKVGGRVPLVITVFFLFFDVGEWTLRVSLWVSEFFPPWVPVFSMIGSSCVCTAGVSCWRVTLEVGHGIEAFVSCVLYSLTVS